MNWFFPPRELWLLSWFQYLYIPSMLKQIPMGSSNTIMESQKTTIRTESEVPWERETSLLPLSNMSEKTLKENYLKTFSLGEEGGEG